jgi:hypothetical protein
MKLQLSHNTIVDALTDDLRDHVQVAPNLHHYESIRLTACEDSASTADGLQTAALTCSCAMQ